jgi:hypothetical protein
VFLADGMISGELRRPTPESVLAHLRLQSLPGA